MRAIRIDKALDVTEVEGPIGDWMTDDVDWTTIPLGKDHDIFVDDNGLFGPGVVVADIGEHPRVPLPAYIAGADGEATVDATMTVEEVRGLLG